MPKTRNIKTSLLDSYKEALKENVGYIAINPDKVNNITITDLKKKLKEVDSRYIVVKNTLFKIALTDAKMPVTTTDFDGSTAILTYKSDPTVIAKLLREKQKETEQLSAKYGFVEGEYIDSQRVMQLADIPSKDELYAKMLGSFNAPVSGFMNVITGNLKGFVRILSALAAKGN